MELQASPPRGSLDRALVLLELLAEHGDLRASEIAELLETSKPTAFRLLASLRGRGFVEQAPGSRRYRLGPAFRALAARSEAPAVIALATPVMGELRASTGETVNLATVQRGRIVYAAVLDSLHPLRMSATVGEELHPHATALGKAVLAAEPPELRSGFLGAEPFVALTDRTITTRRALDADLATTATRGYAVDDEESALGAICLGAAILGADGRPVGALSVSAPLARLPARTHRAVGRIVKHRCDGISAELALLEPPIATGARS
ncbi:MAG TPA: IclR family transcriptional regulator [Actinomycetota bacterium]|jgi:IclR family acetate operon transcriptional repressor